jgi:small subunit ribosomal protein S6
MHYELGLIVNPNVPETEHNNVQEQVLGYLKKINAKIERDFYSGGRRKLAYPIKNQKHGFYLYLEFSFPESELKAVKLLDHELKLDNNILRHLIVKRQKVASNADVLRWQQVNKLEISRKPKRPGSARPARPMAIKPVEAKAVVKNDISLDDIDKKLDEILASEPKVD